MKKHGSICILVATHKKYRMPSDKIYMPIQVGKAGKEQLDLSYIGDDTGDHISHLNADLSEMTALYWGWKNMHCDYIGLVHYRRHFRLRRKLGTFRSILTGDEAKSLLRDSDIVLPRKRFYFFDTLYKHYEGYDFALDTDLPLFRALIAETGSDYAEAFDRVMKRHSGHMCNMFIMKKELADAFCEWAFPILIRFDRRIDQNRYSRIPSYVAEHMLDIWIERNRYSYVECGDVRIEWKNELCRRIDYVLRKVHLPMRLIRLKV